MKPYELIDSARAWARAAHRDQVDDNGANHFDHCEAVAEILELIAPDDYALQAAAYLHDTLEDTATHYEDLLAVTNQDVADLVVEVTKVEGAFPNLHSRRGIMLKFADRLHNLSRMHPWDDKKQAWYMRKSRFW